MNPAARTRRPHPVGLLRGEPTRRCASPGTPGAEQVRRSVPGLTLIRGGKLPADTLLRHRARCFARLTKAVDGFRPTYRRRDMIGAWLRMALLNANAAEIQLDDKQIASIALTVDEETQRSRVVVRSKRGRKAP